MGIAQPRHKPDHVDPSMEAMAPASAFRLDPPGARRHGREPAREAELPAS